MRGRVGTGYCYTSATGGPAVISLLERSLSPSRRTARPRRSGGSGVTFSSPHPPSGRGDHLAGAPAVIGQTALWDLRCRQGGTAALAAWPAGRAVFGAAVHHGRRLAAPVARKTSPATPPKNEGRKGLIRAKVKMGKPTHLGDRVRSPRCAERSGRGLPAHVDAKPVLRSWPRRCAGPTNAGGLRRRVREPPAGRRMWAPRPPRGPFPRARRGGREHVFAGAFKDYHRAGRRQRPSRPMSRALVASPLAEAALSPKPFRFAVCAQFLMELHSASSAPCRTHATRPNTSRNSSHNHPRASEYREGPPTRPKAGPRESSGDWPCHPGPASSKAPTIRNQPREDRMQRMGMVNRVEA